MPVIKKKNTQLIEKLEYIEAALSESTISPELIDQICEYIREGVPKKLVAQAVGISYATFLKWIRIGEGRESLKVGDITEYKIFVKKLGQAEALAKIDYIRLMKKAAEGGIVLSEKETTSKTGEKQIDKKYSSPSWMASAWYLERRDTEHFGKKHLLEEITNDEEKVDEEIFTILNKRDNTETQEIFLN